MNEWENVFKVNLKTYIQLISEYLGTNNSSIINVVDAIERLPFKLPKGLTKKEIQQSGAFPVVSQSKDLIIGYSDKSSNLVSESLPLIVYGDHSKTIKYIDFPFVIGADGVKLLKPIDTIYPKFFYYSLIGVEVGTKSYGRHFGLIKAKSIIIPNSIQTQKKVVNFIDDLANNCLKKGEEYFSKNIEDKIIQIHLNEINGHKINIELTRQQNLLKKLRQQILQDAIEGKLTKDWREQNPDVEPASELLKRIQAEKEQLIKDKKIKKQKALPAITDDEKPFELPESWVWLLLDESAYMTRGSSPRPISSYITNNTDGVNWIKIGDTKNVNKVIVKTHQKITKEGASKSQLVEIGDFILSNSMSFGKPFIMGIEGYIHDGWFLIKLFKAIDVDYFYNLLTSLFVQNQFLESASGAVVKNIRADIVKKTMLPIPPFEEQKEIVKKVENLFAICDQLEEQITSSQTNAEQLMQSVLKEAFSQDEKAA